MDTFITTVYLIVFSSATLILISLGLAIIFGLMKVINLAHGEFMMLGAYVCVLSVQAGVPLWLGIVLAGLCVGLFGVLVERLVIRHLYGRLVDTLLATWGLSLMMVGGVTTLFGASGMGLSTHMGSSSLAGVNISNYNLVLIALSLLLLLGSWLLARYTKAGLLVRGTMQNGDMAAALGVNPSLVQMGTFAYGSMLAGMAGAILAPLTGVSPSMGLFFIAKSFITVIVGGPLPLMGSSTASSLFGFIDGIVAYHWSSIMGEAGVLLAAIILLRILPVGITGRFRSGI